MTDAKERAPFVIDSSDSSVAWAHCGFRYDSLSSYDAGLHFNLEFFQGTSSGNFFLDIQ